MWKGLKISMKKITAIFIVISMLICTGCSTTTIVNNEAQVTVTTEAQTEKNITTTTTSTTTKVTTTKIDDRSTPDKFDKTVTVPARTLSRDDAFTYDHGTEFKGCCIYEFDDDITMGAVSLDNLKDYSSKILDFEAYYGIKAYTKGFNIYFKAYNHSHKKHPISKSVCINSAGSNKAMNISYDKQTELNCSDLPQGLYAVRVTFDTMDMNLYFYVASNGVFTCRYMSANSYRPTQLTRRRDKVRSAIAEAGVKPENSLSNADIMYPQMDSATSRCDTDLWIKLSHDLVDGHNWSDEFKLFVFNEWIMKNIKYDMWRMNNGQSRAKEYNVWDGTYSMWDMRAGVCCDFANVLIIMLREHGIPATSLESDDHMWVAAYLDGDWREVDTTGMMPYKTYTLDASDCKNEKSDYNYYCFWYNNQPIKFVGADIWTYERIKTGKNVYK